MELKRKILKAIKSIKDPEKIICIYIFIKKIIENN